MSGRSSTTWSSGDCSCGRPDVTGEAVPLTSRRVRDLLRAVPRGERLGLLVALLSFAAAELAVRILAPDTAFRLVGARIALTADLHPVHCLRPLDPRERRRLRAINRVARHWPFGRGPCLREALVTARALPRRDVAVRFGIARDVSGLDAHAWVEIDGCELGTGEGYQPFIVRPRVRAAIEDEETT